MARRVTVTKRKAKKILKDGSVRGTKLTAKQKRFFGARASGLPDKSKKMLKRKK